MKNYSQLSEGLWGPIYPPVWVTGCSFPRA